MIRIRNLLKSYPSRDHSVTACQVDALDVTDGEQVALIGRSGLGKTTLLNCMAGITRPDRGTIEIDNIDIVKLSEGRRDLFRAEHLGMVFQTFNLLQPFSALENVVLGAVFGRKAKDGVEDRARDLLQRVGLGDRIDHKPSQLSVGQQQRVAMCRALVNDPKLILADEPLGNQDKQTGLEVLDILLEMVREGQRTLIMVTHDPDSAARMQRTVDLATLRKDTGTEVS